MVPMLARFREASTLASRSNRAIRSGSPVKASGRTLRATSRSSLVSVARWVDFKKRFKKAYKAAEIENVRFHDLRHTFTSHLVMSGIDEKTAQELLGHHDLSMTMKYAHLAPDHRLRAVKILDSAYQSDTVEKSGKNQSA